ncbi:MAG: immunoglobulin domain-containing protein [Dysgonamonadaceae bacterium]|jgi:hypothetical protein|nr:immunoglobulin domain-containing protein [Dysgonamonadaceae bacterium]
MRLRTFFWLLALVMTGAASVNAQVNIGSVDDPHKGAILDLSRNTSEFGVLFPKVHLFSTEALQLQADEGVSATGMVVYNINADLPDGTGLYAWNGSKWESMRNDVNICASVKATAESKKVESTKNVEITVTVTSGNPTYNYIWTKNGTIVWLNVNTNAASDSYVTTGAGNYAVTVTNPCTSNPVTFTFTVDEDGEILIDNGNGTYTDKDGNLVYEGNTYKPVESDIPGIYLKITEDEGDILVYTGADGIPGTPDDDVFVVPDYPLRKQETQFSVKYPVVIQQDGTYQIELDFADGRSYANSPEDTYTGQIKFISDVSAGILSISETGSITAGPDANKSITYAVILEDGSTTSVTATIRPKNANIPILYHLAGVSDSDATVTAGSIKKIATTWRAKDNSINAYNMGTLTYEITDAANTGSTVTSGGWFQAGTPGVVTVTATATPNDDNEIKFTGTITVTVTGEPAPENNYVTASTNWAALEPAPAYAGGDGTAANPYKISSVRQFKKLAVDIEILGSTDATYQKCFELTTDLDFAGDETVKNSLTGGFYGTFDGKGHVIENLDIDAAGKSEVSLFKELKYGEIKNLGRKGGSTFGTDASGAGGLICILSDNGKLRNCYNSSSINIHSSAGGLVWIAYDGAVIENCYNTGNISTTDNGAGGLIGTCLYGGGVLTIKNCYNTGDISTSYAGGGFIYSVNNTLGNKQTLDISNSFNFGTVAISNNSNRTGSLIGWILESNSALVEVNATNVYSKPGVVSANEVPKQNQPIGWNTPQETAVKDAVLAANLTMGEDPKYTLEYSQSVKFVEDDLGGAFWPASGRTPKLTWE